MVISAIWVFLNDLVVQVCCGGYDLSTHASNYHIWQSSTALLQHLPPILLRLLIRFVLYFDHLLFPD